MQEHVEKARSQGYQRGPGAGLTARQAMDSCTSCLDCHYPHNGQTLLPVSNNALCMKCHAGGERGAVVIDAQTHSHHKPGGARNSCVECHMPRRIYMGRDARRDHGFTIPDPVASVPRGEPDACSQCHEDKPAEWAAR